MLLSVPYYICLIHLRLVLAHARLAEPGGQEQRGTTLLPLQHQGKSSDPCSLITPRASTAHAQIR